jgi:hypothetical protein
MFNKLNTRSLENSPSKYYHEQKILKAYKNSFIDRLSYMEEKRKFKKNRRLYIYQQRKKNNFVNPTHFGRKSLDLTNEKTIDKVFGP